MSAFKTTTGALVGEGVGTADGDAVGTAVGLVVGISDVVGIDDGVADGRPTFIIARSTFVVPPQLNVQVRVPNGG